MGLILTDLTGVPGLLSVYLLMKPYFPHFVIHFLLLDVPNMYNAQRVTPYFKYRNIDGRNPSFACINMYLGWRLDNLSCQDLNSYCKVDITSENMLFSIFLVQYSLIYLYSPLRKLD